jgi:hypothetical protein
MKTYISIKNFFTQNTPLFWQMLGDISMFCSFLIGLPAIINEIATQADMTIAIPLIIVKVSKIAAAVLMTIKMLTKFVGSKSLNDQASNNK